MSSVSRPFPWLIDISQDVCTAWRNARRAPLAAIVVVLSLAFGIGAATSALVVRNAIFYNPPPLYVDPAALSRVQAGPLDRPIFPAGSDVPAALFSAWREAIAFPIAASGEARTAEVRARSRVDTALVRPVTANVFRVVGVQPMLGRVFDDESASAVPEAILSHRLWERVFSARPDIVGANITLDGQPYDVIGVMPPPFWLGGMDAPIWVRLDERALSSTAMLRTIVRRPSGTSERDLTTALQSGVNGYNARRAAGQPPLRIRVSPVRGTPMGDAMSIVLPYILGVAVILTLFIACANAAILLIAQWAAREAETAVRSSLGAGRGRLLRTLLTEAVILSLAAGVLGIIATAGLRWWLLQQIGGGNSLIDLSIPVRVLLQSAAVAAAAGILAGLAPALYETRRIQFNPLRGLQGSDRLRQRWSHALVALEIAITVGLLVATSSMVAGYQRLREAQFGFDLNPLVFASFVSERDVQTATLLDGITALPGVEAAAIGTSVPLFLGRQQQGVSAGADAPIVRAQRTAITPEYFDAVGVRIRAGRSFGRAEPSQRAIVNEALARQLFGATAAIGRQLWIERRPYDIVGVVADFATTFAEAEVIGPKFFVPIGTEPANTRLTVLVRVADRPEVLVQPLRRALVDLVPAGRVSDPDTYVGIMSVVGQEWLLAIAPLGPLVTIGMLMSGAGIYGILAFAIARRVRELAIRRALGASGRDQVRLIARRSIRLVLLGTVGGIGFTFVLSRIVRASGGAGSMYDPPLGAFLLPVVMIVLLAAIATWVPAARARRIDPATLLRST